MATIKLIGDAPNQVSRNRDLGDLAYQDAENIAGDVGVGGALTVVGETFVSKITASTGILFGTDTAAANTLDDYEEGTWTPTASDGAVDTTTGTGFYTKIGRKVFCEFVISNISTTGMTAGNDFVISGLPFNVLVYGAEGMGTAALGSVTFVGSPSIYLPGGSPSSRIALSSTGAAFSILKVSGLTTGSADVAGSFSYLV